MIQASPSDLTVEKSESSVTTAPLRSAPTHLLHFEPLAGQGASLDIPCDREGQVGLDTLGDKARNDYFYARALIGCLFARPTVKLPA